MEGEAASSEAAVTASAEGLASQVPTGNEPEKCMSEGDKAPAASQKHPRKRLKGVLKSVQDQLEFYFGDANLRRDKFLKGKMAQHPEGYVEVDVICSFKKLQSMTSDRSIIVRGIQQSSLLELTSDAKWVRRKDPIQNTSEDQINARTIYVESLPKLADHDMVQRLFKRFGTITYVSLPRFKPSNEIKGFGFIEFSSCEEADCAIEFFKNDKPSRGDENTSLVEDSVFLEITNEQNQEVMDVSAVKKKRDREEEEEDAQLGEPANSAKRVKLGDPSDTEQPSSSDCHSCTDIESSADNKITTGDRDPVSSLGKRKRNESEASAGEEDSAVMEEGGAVKSRRVESEVSTDEGKRKKRVHKKKRRESVADQLKALKLRVLPKTEWLEMKTLFKKMQKDQMKKVKVDNRKVISNGGGGGGNDLDKKKFVQNCLVKVTCSEQCTATVQQIKELCLKFGPVAFVDLRDSDKEGYVRYGESGCVEGLVGSGEVDLKGVEFSAVTEEEEKEYFLRTSSARRGVTRVNKRKNTRGQDKVITKALQRIQKKKSSHVRFSDSE